MGNRYLYGLLTSNNILSKDELKVNDKLILNFINSKNIYEFVIKEDTFVFTSPFLDVSIVEIPINSFEKVEYLKIKEVPVERQKILSIHVNSEGKINFVEGNTLGFFGTYIYYNLTNSNLNNSECTPIITLSQDSLGFVIGLYNNYVDIANSAHKTININIILRSIKGLVHQNKITASQTLSPAKKLSLTELHVLRKEGLKETENPYVFISPGSQGITPLWFYRTHYAWFWTPTEPKDFTLDEIKKCNWSLIQTNFPIKAIGGMWNNMGPATRNVILIQFLINSGLRFLNE